MTEAYTIAVDSGKYLTKAIRIDQEGKYEFFSINSLIRKTEETKSPIANRYILTLNGESTYMGAEDGIINSNHTKATDVHKRSTYLAISKLIPNGSTINLAIGTPLSIFKVANETEKYKKFMLNLDETEDIVFPITIQFEVNEESFEYVINSLNVYAESSGYMLMYEEKHLEEQAAYVGIVDIGGLNINASLYMREAVDAQKSGVLEEFKLDLTEENTFTADLGTNYLYDLLNTRLTPIEGIGQLNRSQLENVLKNGYFGIAPKGELYDLTAPIVTEVKQEYFDKIKAAIRKWKFGMTHVVFVGGGSLLLTEQIENDKDIYFSEISHNSQWENVIGFALNLYDNREYL